MPIHKKVGKIGKLPSAYRVQSHCWDSVIFSVTKSKLVTQQGLWRSLWMQPSFLIEGGTADRRGLPQLYLTAPCLIFASHTNSLMVRSGISECVIFFSLASPWPVYQPVIENAVSNHGHCGVLAWRGAQCAAWRLPDLPRTLKARLRVQVIADRFIAGDKMPLFPSDTKYHFTATTGLKIWCHHFV